MRRWFTRQGHDAINGETSYTGYCKWFVNGSPTQSDKNKYIEAMYLGLFWEVILRING